MRIVFLPVRSTIDESFSDSKVFNSIRELFAFHRDCGIAHLNEFCLEYYCFDSRFLCDCYALTSWRFRDQRYDRPQMVGFVYFGLTKACMAKRLSNFLNK